jgi:hypothetical protein
MRGAQPERHVARFCTATIDMWSLEVTASGTDGTGYLQATWLIIVSDQFVPVTIHRPTNGFFGRFRFFFFFFFFFKSEDKEIDN